MKRPSPNNDNKTNSKAKKRRKVLHFNCDLGHKFSVDKDDYSVVSELVRASRNEDDVPEATRRCITTRKKDKNRRVLKLHMHMYKSKITSLPPSIGRLKNIESLHFYYAFNLFELPDEIGELVNLKELLLNLSAIELLPPSIGQLKNLEILGLYQTQKLQKLPDEIGNLVNLKELCLSNSSINLLPPSIGQLKNLQILKLSFMKHIFELPKEIGDLVNLNELYLRASKIEMLPPSIGQLKNLKILNLSNAKQMVELPDEIGGLVNLRELNLRHSAIKMLPPSIEQLRSLEHLDLQDTKNLFELPVEVGNLASLRTLKLRRSRFLPPLLLTVSVVNKLGYPRACEQARYLMKFGIGDGDCSQISSILWPLMLNCVARACIPQHERLNPNSVAYHCKDYRIPKPDALYQILLHGRESFIRILLDRDTNGIPMEPKAKLKTTRDFCPSAFLQRISIGRFVTSVISKTRYFYE